MLYDSVSFAYLWSYEKTIWILESWRESSWFQPKYVYVDGDGTVPVESAMVGYVTLFSSTPCIMFMVYTK